MSWSLTIRTCKGLETMWVTMQASSPAASVMCPRGSSPRLLPTAVAHSGLLFLNVKMRWCKAEAAASNLCTAVSKGPEGGTSGLALPGDPGLPKLPCWSVRTQADVVLL